MSNPWFRLYTEIVDDEKLRLLAFEDRWHFIALMCCKGKGIQDEENKSLMRRKIAVKLGLDTRELDEVARRLAEVELIDAETLQPLAWDRRQFVSDQDPTRNERKRRFREKQKDSGGNGSGTHEERLGNGSGTHEERTPESESESESDTDTEKKQKKSSVCHATAREKMTTDDGQVFFDLTPERIAAAKERGVTDLAWLEKETSAFIDFNRDVVLYNPDAAWLAFLQKGKARKGCRIQKAAPNDNGYVHSGRSI